jgi:hypothetical protein
VGEKYNNRNDSGHPMAGAKKTSTKRSSKRMKKLNARHYPVVLGSELGSTVENTALRFLQVDRCLSKLNRRLYRMGRYYKVKIDVDQGANGNFEVYALRDDWAVQKAYQMAYKMYLENTADERERLASSQIARWEDFRVDHGLTGNELVPVVHNITTARGNLVGGEFELANVVDSNDTQRSFTWGTPSATEYGLLQEFDKAGSVQTDPTNVEASGPYEGINSEVNAQTMDDLQGDGNLPPYDTTVVNASFPFVRIATLGDTAGAQRLSTGYFTAPCGIVIIVGSGSNWNSNDLLFEVAKGDYKGVHAPSMLE